MNVERETSFLEFFANQEDFKKRIDSAMFSRSHNRDDSEYSSLFFQVFLQAFPQIVGVHTSGSGDLDVDEVIYPDSSDG